MSDSPHGTAVVVADAGPPIHLDELDCIAIRRQQLSKEQVAALLRQIPVRTSLHIRPALLSEIVQLVESLPPSGNV